MNYEKHPQLQELFNIVKSSTFEFQKLHWLLTVKKAFKKLTFFNKIIFLLKN